MALITALDLCGRSLDSLLSVLVLRVRAAFSTTGFEGIEKLCSKTNETPALRGYIPQASRTKPGSSPSHWCTVCVHGFLDLCSRSQDSIMSLSDRRVNVVSRLLDWCRRAAY